MNKIIIVNQSNYVNLVKSITSYIEWINSNKKLLDQNIKIIIHDSPVYSYGQLSDCQIDFDNRNIYYSLYNIEEYLVTKKRNNIIVNDLEYALSEIIFDLNYHIAHFYILSFEHITYKDLISHFDCYEDNIMRISNYLTFKYLFNHNKCSISYKDGLTMKFDSGINNHLKHAFLQFRDFIKKELNFPLKVNIHITSSELEDAQGYFQHPTSLFTYPKIVVSTYRYAQLKKEMSLFDSDLNTLRILAHEIGHYQDYISNNISLDENTLEKIANKYEDKLTQKFIDHVYYLNYIGD
ncbi:MULTISPECIES: hypothetical protein [Mammaliicoccus]|uniref:hypothetical protein n=1 Tax=Mammaliicoccus TaxID=2803850 RepID=UPI001AACBE5E|nr:MULTISPECIES: hypothetical protein [Mammaliicoccus]MBO3063408.1 hypothetical protein [Mammaliicoccus fleurettii]